MDRRQTMFQQQKHFMEACGQAYDAGEKQIQLYVDLVKEEFKELNDAWCAADMAIGETGFDAEAAIIETLDGAVDTMVVLYGVLVSMGIDADIELEKHLGRHESGCLFQHMAEIEGEPIELNGVLANQKRKMLETMIQLVYAEWEVIKQLSAGAEKLNLNKADEEKMVRAVIYAISLCASLINALGINGPMAWEEVWSSNMTKLDAETGKAIHREDGKIMKPDSFRPVDLLTVVKKSYGIEDAA